MRLPLVMLIYGHSIVPALHTVYVPTTMIFRHRRTATGGRERDEMRVIYIIIYIIYDTHTHTHTRMDNISPNTIICVYVIIPIAIIYITTATAVVIPYDIMFVRRRSDECNPKTAWSRRLGRVAYYYYCTTLLPCYTCVSTARGPLATEKSEKTAVEHHVYTTDERRCYNICIIL